MSDLFRKVGKKNSSKENIYERYGFTQNPFPNKTSINIGNPDPRNNGSIYVPELRTNEIGQFNRIVIPSSLNTEPKPISFLMDYATRKGRGIGKTAFLSYQKRQIQQDLGDSLSGGTEVLASVFVSPRPDDNYKKFHSISKLIIESIIDQGLIAIISTRLMAFSGIIDEKVLKKTGGTISETIDTIGNADWLINAHKDEKIDFDSHHLTQTVRSQLLGQHINSDLATAVARFGTNNDYFKKYYFDKFNESYWKQNANQLLFHDFVKLFQSAGVTKTIILFDELEKIIPKQNASERRDFCDILRYYFIDGNCQNSMDSFFHILFVIHPYLQELLLPHWEASGMQRFASLGGELSHDYTVFFESFGEQTATPLARAYLDEARIINTDKGSLSPFTQEALNEALKKTLGVPGKYLNMLHSAVRRGIEEGWETIDVANIKAVEMPIVSKDEDEDLESPLTEPKSKI